MNRLLKRKKKSLLTLAATLALIVILALVAVACATDANTSSESKPPEGNPYQTSVLGEFETIGEDPDMLADGTSGTSVHEGAGDETLQQDRVSGGANTGGVASQNLPDLKSDLIKPQSDKNPAPDLLKMGTPPAILHGFEGRDDCTSCHGDAASEKPLPRDHVKAQITNDLCLTCHKA